MNDIYADYLAGEALPDQMEIQCTDCIGIVYIKCTILCGYFFPLRRMHPLEFRRDSSTESSIECTNV